MRALHRPAATRWLITSGAAALAGVTLLAAVPASADTKVHATYKVTGSTFLKGPDFTMNLGPGTLTSTVDAKKGKSIAKLTATLTLPNATGSFKQYGVIPVTSTTQFINDGPTTGTLNFNTGAVKTTSKITLRIVSLVVAGVNVPVGKSCETTQPVVATVRSQPGFSVLKGGSLAGSYTIGDFSHCELATVLINSTIPGSGNTITLTLGKAKVGK
jgi:hypothetical protein